MNGNIKVTYKILCKTDLNKQVSITDLLQNEKIIKIIKSEYAKGLRNIELLSTKEDASIKIETLKELHTFEVDKNDYADLLELAEEDASAKKLLKKDCDRIELVDIETSIK